MEEISGIMQMEMCMKEMLLIPINWIAEISYTDGTRKDLSDFTIKMHRIRLQQKMIRLHTESVLGELDVCYTNTQLRISHSNCKTVYEGKYPSDHFQYVASFDDDTERELLADDLETARKTVFCKGENKITMKYLGKNILPA
ncbi:MAG: hypothetical protein ACLTX3_08965 [Lachnospiraceae bacterium]